MKEEGWWLILGSADREELHALKRVSLRERTTARLTFPVKNSGGPVLKGATLYCCCDSYLGLDQQYWLDASPPALKP